MASTKRARTSRREAERAALKLADARIRLARLEAGGSPERPIEIASASVVEVHASSLPCLGCGNEGTRVEDHAAKTIAGQALRIVTVRCPRCGTRREIYFRLGSALPS